MKLMRTLIALIVFGISFGGVEAAVVVYLRAIYQPFRDQALTGKQHDEIFPLLTPDQVQGDLHTYVLVTETELWREFATIVMLASVALAIAGNFRCWLAGFMIAFGIWDIFYYVFLKVLINWPASLWTWDFLFSLPVPWVGPVIAPVIVALFMIAVGRPIPFRWFHWAAVWAGGVGIVVAFCWDWRNAVASRMPMTFNWPLLIAGEAISLTGFVGAMAQSVQERPRKETAEETSPA